MGPPKKSGGGPHLALEVADDYPPGSGKGSARHSSAASQMGLLRGKRQQTHQRFPWKPGPVQHARDFLQSTTFLQALQLAVGELFVASFTLAQPLNFPVSCISTIFFVAAVVILSRDFTVGSRLMAAAMIIGNLWFGIVLAGATISLAHAPHVAYSVFACVFAALALVPIAAVRARLGPLGILINLGFGICMIQLSTLWPAGMLWQKGVGYFILDGVVAAGGCIVSGLFVFPRLARDELRSTVAQAVQTTGQCVSGYASYIFADRPPCFAKPSCDAAADSSGKADAADRAKQRQQNGHAQRPGGAAAASGAPAGASSKVSLQLADRSESEASEWWSAAGEQHADDECWRTAIDKATSPAAQARQRYQGRPGAPPVTAIRPMLIQAKQLLEEAAAEPPFLNLRKRMLLAPWGALLKSLDGLVLKTAALESLLEGDRCVLDGRRLSQQLGVDTLPAFRLVYAAVAAALSELAEALRTQPGDSRARRHKPLFGPAWPLLEAELASALHAAIRAYGRRFMQDSRAQPSYEVRALLYVATLTAALMEAMDRVEAAGCAVLDAQTVLPPPWHWWRACCPPVMGVAPTRSSPGSSLHGLMTRQHESDASGSLAAATDALVTEPIRRALHELVRRSLERSAAGGAGASTPRSPRSFRIFQQPRPLSQRPSAAPPQPPAQRQSAALQATPYEGRSAATLAPAQQLAAVVPSQPSGQQFAALSGDGEQQYAAPTEPCERQSASSPDPSQPPSKTPEGPYQRTSATAWRQRHASADSSGVVNGAQPGCEDDRRQPADTDNPGRWRALRPWLVNEVAWIKPLLLAVSGLAIFKAWYELATREVPERLRSRSKLRHTFRHSRRFQFFLKFYLATAATMAGVLALQLNNSGVASWRPLYLYVSIVVVMSEKVEYTVVRGVMRLVGTIVGGTLAFVVMLHSDMATNPYGLMVVLCAGAFIGGLFLGSQYKYAVFLTLITLDAVILCQYSPRPGAHGSARYYYARLADIAIGVLLVLLVDQILPWYVSIGALETLGEASAKATRVAARFYEVFYRELRRAAAADDPGCGEELEQQGLAELEDNLIAEQIATPLGSVNLSLQRETVVWRHGPLKLPPVVVQLAGALQVLLERLAALEAVLTQAPIVSGRFTGFPFLVFVRPLHPMLQAGMEKLTQLGETTCKFLRCEDGATAERVLQLVDELIEARLAVRHEYLRLLAEFYSGMHGNVDRVSLHPPAAMVSPDLQPPASDEPLPRGIADGDSASPGVPGAAGQQGSDAAAAAGDSSPSSGTSAGSRAYSAVKQSTEHSVRSGAAARDAPPAASQQPQRQRQGAAGQPDTGAAPAEPRWQGDAAAALAQKRTLDDTTRLLSFLFALGKVFDKAALLARIAAEDPFLAERCRHRRGWLHWRLWFGA